MSLTIKKLEKAAEILGVNYWDVRELLLRKHHFGNVIDTLVNIYQAKKVSVFIHEECLPITKEDEEHLRQKCEELALEEVLSADESISESDASDLLENCPCDSRAEQIAEQLYTIAVAKNKLAKLKNNLKE